MPYRRPDIKKPEKVHKIEDEFGVYGMINTGNDPGWIAPYLADLHDEGRFGLHQFSGAVTRAKEMNLSDFKPEIAAAKRAEIVLTAKRALMTFLKKQIQKFKDEVVAVGAEISRISEPTQPSDPLAALRQDLRFREIRDNLRNIDPKHRHAAIEGSLERIQACISNPDPSDVIIDKNVLTEMRRQYAFSVDPTLLQKEKDQQQIYKVVRQRAADISATSVRMLQLNEIADPLPPREFYEIFPPISEHEAVYIQKRIQNWDRQQMAEERKKELAERNEGVNLEAENQTTRLHRR